MVRNVDNFLTQYFYYLFQHLGDMFPWHRSSIKKMMTEEEKQTEKKELEIVLNGILVSPESLPVISLDHTYALRKVDTSVSVNESSGAVQERTEEGDYQASELQNKNDGTVTACMSHTDMNSDNQSLTTMSTIKMTNRDSMKNASESSVDELKGTGNSEGQGTYLSKDEASVPDKERDERVGKHNQRDKSFLEHLSAYLDKGDAEALKILSNAPAKLMVSQPKESTLDQAKGISEFDKLLCTEKVVYDKTGSPFPVLEKIFTADESQSSCSENLVEENDSVESTGLSIDEESDADGKKENAAKCKIKTDRFNGDPATNDTTLLSGVQIESNGSEETAHDFVGKTRLSDSEINASSALLLMSSAESAEESEKEGATAQVDHNIDADENDEESDDTRSQEESDDTKSQESGSGSQELDDVKSEESRSGSQDEEEENIDQDIATAKHVS